ncbi:MAG: major capsid protein E [Microbacterium sp.]|nr:MAG: major capsid protein E [Microbacterium sp.]
MALWTDIIEPAELTGYARAALEDYERRKGTLARWLPNREVADIVVRFVKGQSGLVPEAKYRAYDAEPGIGKQEPRKRVTLELPALSENIPVSEYEQLRSRGASDDVMRKSILSTTRRVVAAIADRAEQLRGVVINTGVATIAELASADSFGRAAEHDVTAPSWWTDPDADRLAFLEDINDIYSDTNGVAAGSTVMTRKVFRAFAAGNQFRTQLINNQSRPATDAEINAIVTGAGFAAITVFDRRTYSGRVLDDRKLFLLPEPVDTDDWQGTELGATFWGQSLTSTDDRYGIEESDQPGIVAGVYRGEKPPLIAEVVGDSINLPVLANANLSLAATVLPAP